MKSLVAVAEDRSNENCRETYLPLQHQWLFKLYDIFTLLSSGVRGTFSLDSCPQKEASVVAVGLYVWPCEVSSTRRKVNF